MADFHALEKHIINQFLNQSQIEIIKDYEEDANNNNNTLDFIDKKFVKTEVHKAAENIKMFIRKEMNSALKSKSLSLSHGGFDEISGSEIGSKHKIINSLENQILFLEEENRRKNNTIDSLIQGLTSWSSVCQNSENPLLCNVQKDECDFPPQNITLRKHKEKVRDGH